MTLVAELVVDHHLAFGVLRTASRRVRVRSSTYLNNVVEQDHRAGRMDYKLVSAA
jgi:transposase-like protein